MNLDKLIQFIRRECLKVMGERREACLGVVTSYDAASYSVKVELQPWQVESGWLPLGALHSGRGFGVYAAPNIGDQVTVGFIGGQPAWVVSRHFAGGAPLPVPAGEIWLVHEKGSRLVLDNAGALTLQQGGASVAIAENGALTVTGANNAASVSISPSGAVAVSAASISLTASGNLNLAGAAIISSGPWAHTGALDVTGVIAATNGGITRTLP